MKREEYILYKRECYEELERKWLARGKTDWALSIRQFIETNLTANTNVICFATRRNERKENDKITVSK